MSTRIIWINKPLGKTPKECVDEVRSTLGLSDAKIGYAGRLDPMAYGLMPLVVADVRNTVMDRLNLQEKTYEWKLILGLSSDTYDVLGIPHPATLNPTIPVVGPLEQDYPPYSSKTVYDDTKKKKIPLWSQSKSSTVQKKLPSHTCTIYSIEELSRKECTAQEILATVENRVARLDGSYDFRQALILTKWHELMHKTNTTYTILHMRAKVSSGCYIRGIGNSMGGICYDICRVAFGDESHDIIESDTNSCRVVSVQDVK